jgi:hypothetical protein
MTTQFQIQDIADANVDNTQEALVPALKLALVEYLNSNNG